MINILYIHDCKKMVMHDLLFFCFAGIPSCRNILRPDIDVQLPQTREARHQKRVEATSQRATADVAECPGRRGRGAAEAVDVVGNIWLVGWLAGNGRWGLVS